MPDFYEGNLQVNVTAEGILTPIENATVTISDTGNPEVIVDQLTTDSSGQTAMFPLTAPSPEYSLDPEQLQQPYSEYNCLVEAPGYESKLVSAMQILAGTRSLQPIRLRPIAPGLSPTSTVIPAHTLYGEYPAKIPEPEVKPMAESGEIILSRIVIPEYIVVHDGVPSDPTAPNYYVKYKDYIKNVASSEIYATWPESTIYANLLVIMSFTMNRVYTEYYRSLWFQAENNPPV